MAPWLWASVSFAADGPGYKSPNAMVGVTAGTPTTVGLRGEQWLSDDVSGEIGVGVAQFDELAMVFDWAIRWRPDFACLGCGQRALVTFGLGPGGTVIPPVGFESGPWTYSLGLDLSANGVLWVGPAVGLMLGVRGGGGALVEGTDFDAIGGTGWVMGTAGLAF